MDVNIDTKVAMIIGACTPIGLAICLKCLKLGYNVAATDNDEQKLNDLRKSLENSGNGQILTISVDFSVHDDHRSVLDRFSQQFDRLDLLINNSEATKLQLLCDIYHEDFYQDYTKTMSSKLFSAYQMSQIFSKLLIKSGDGVIINIAAMSDHPSICIANSGLVMLTRALANDFENKGVRLIGVELKRRHGPSQLDDVSIVSPTDDIKNADEVADFVVSYLGSPGSSFINGTTIVVNVVSDN